MKPQPRGQYPRTTPRPPARGRQDDHTKVKTTTTATSQDRPHGQKVKKGDFMFKRERLYLNSYEYNAARILSALAVIVENNGGEVIYKKYDSEYELTNRTAFEKLYSEEATAERIEEVYKEHKDEKCKSYLEAAKKRVEEAKAATHTPEAETPIICSHKSYIRFVYENYYYSYNIDSNPFFEFYICKAPIKTENNRRTYDANRYLIESSKSWLYDVFFEQGAAEADIKEAANLLFNELVKAPAGELVTDRQRVSNTYDNRYHYERIHRKNIKDVDDDF